MLLLGLPNRDIEPVFERLITWAAVAIETSSNQTVLPHVIIVLNFMLPKTALTKSPETLRPTTTIFSGSLTVPSIRMRHLKRKEKKRAHFWRKRKNPITTLTELISCYYASVKVRIVLLPIGIPRLGLQSIRFYGFPKKVALSLCNSRSKICITPRSKHVSALPGQGIVVECCWMLKTYSHTFRRFLITTQAL